MKKISNIFISFLSVLFLFVFTFVTGCSVEKFSENNDLSNEESSNNVNNNSNSNNSSSNDVSNTNTPSSDNSSSSTPSSEPVKKVTITFNSNGGTNCDSITQEVGSALTLPQPTKTDYDFVGWYTQNEINENYLFDSKVMPNEDITLYAGWELQDNIYMNDYLSAKNFEEWKSTSTYDVDDYIVIRYFSDEVDVTSKSQYNLNTGINVLQDGYILNWYKDKDFKDNLATQKDYLKYGDNVYFATITTSSGQFVSAYAVNIYVYHDYTYTYYEYQPGYKLASKMKAYGTQKVSETKIVEPLTLSNGYPFKEWVTLDNEPFDFSKPVVGGLKLYATYEDIELDIEDKKVTYSPYLTEQLPTKENSLENHYFSGYSSNGVQYFDELGEAINPMPYEALENLEYYWIDNPPAKYYTEEKYFEFSKVNRGYSVSLKEMPLYTTTISIPKEYDNEPIIAIDENAFKNFNEITKIIMPNSVTSIGKDAFLGCNLLESLTLSCTNITYLGYYFGASSYSDNSTYVPTTLKEVIITGGSSIENSAFSGCSSLKSIIIPKSVTSIGERAFKDCSSLESIDIPNSVTSIGSSAFSGCSSLIIYCEASSKPSGWQNQAKDSFGSTIYSWNSSNRPVYWGINDKTYKEENGLRYVIQNGKAVITKCVGNVVEVPDTIQINGKTYSVASIGADAFSNCNSLSRVIYKGTISQWVSKDFGNEYSNPLSMNKLYINGMLYQKKNIVLEEISKIGSSAFNNYRLLESITIPTSVTSIGNSAFKNCSSLQCTITISNGVTSIEDYTFYNCNSLKVTFAADSKLKSIGNYAFYSCDALESIIIPQSTTSIGEYAFAYIRLSNVYLNLTFEKNSQLRSIGAYAFCCTKLEYFKIPTSVTSIGECAFLDSDFVQEIERYGYNQSQSRRRTYIIMPKSVTSIGVHAFGNVPGQAIYCEASSRPSGWFYDSYSNIYWYITSYVTVYFKGKWDYNSNGYPYPIR